MLLEPSGVFIPSGLLLLHIPDGFLSLPVALLSWLVTIGLVALAVRRTANELGERQIPLMGVMAAFIFAAQMINFPVAGGTSGHLLGGVLAAVTLGPWAAMLVMAAVVGVQALLFQDGGLVVMGANILNMGFITALIGYGLYRTVEGRGRTARLAVAGLAAWLSVVAAAFVTALQLWLSGTSSLGVVMPAMLAVHVVIGLGEALITVAALGLILNTRPDLADSRSGQARGGRGWAVAGMLASLAVVLLAPLASSNPDGLERVAEDLGFIDAGVEAPYALLPDYVLPMLGESALSTILAGGIGVAIVAALAVVVARLVRRSRGEPERTGRPAM